MNYNYPINLKNINLLEFKSPDESFENLCKELLENKFHTRETFILGNPVNYPWIEAKPIKSEDWKYVSFQAKYIFDDKKIYLDLKNSFWNKNGSLKIKTEDLEILNILVIICPCNISKYYRNRLETQLKKEKDTLEILFITKKILENILQYDEYAKLRQKYYFNDDVERERQNFSKHEADKSLLNPFIWLEWMPCEKEKERANKDYNEYQMNKLCYIWTDCYVAFNEMEDSILDNIGSTLEWESQFQNDFSLWNLLDSTKKEIEVMITTHPRWSRIKYFLPNAAHKRWVTLQHHQDRKVIIEIKDSKAIYKVNNKNDRCGKNS